MVDSMSPADNCDDDAITESGFGTVRNELEMTQYQTIHDTLKQISPTLRYDDFKRRHSATEYLNPAKFEELRRRSKISKWVVPGTCKTSPDQFNAENSLTSVIR